ncbi:MAG TPA: AmmeMemoRadiSam system protein A [Thermotogota bacterium]|nr:AmmeMemoRadiSam system protein A [Thermotogota bacterium]HRW92205.1 AmmeMemoRadiSam system protein A [Thermotogota bacterium]
MKEQHPTVRWAKMVIESFIKRGQIPELPEDLPAQMLQSQAGVFVSLHGPGNTLRGCIGTIVPTKKNVAMEIRSNAIAAAVNDPRFEPLHPSELEGLEVSVDLLGPPEPVKDSSELDPKKFGVIVENGFKKGLLLPDLEGVDTVEQQIQIARKKAGIWEDEPVQLYRFTVERFH